MEEDIYLIIEETPEPKSEKPSPILVQTINTMGGTTNEQTET